MGQRKSRVFQGLPGFVGHPAIVLQNTPGRLANSFEDTSRIYL